MIKISTIFFVILSIFIILKPVKAQNSLCDYFPFIEVELFGFNSCTGESGDVEATGETIGKNMRFFIGLIFLGIILFGFYQIIRATVKYIQSEGDSEKVGEAQNAIKHVVQGIVIMFVGIIGVILILVLFNATSSLNINETPQDNLFRGIQKGLKSSSSIQCNSFTENCPTSD